MRAPDSWEIIVIVIVSPLAAELPVLMFQSKTDSKYARLLRALPLLPGVTVCAHVQWDRRSPGIGTIFSYAVPEFLNALQLRGRGEGGWVQLALIVQGHHTAYGAGFRNDGHWHHVCATWQAGGGTWAIYADGAEGSSGRGLYQGQHIPGNGSFILGQDQDSLGGSFASNEAFSGNVTGLSLWARALDTGQLAGLSVCWRPPRSLIYTWSMHTLQVEPTVRTVTLHFHCPGTTVYTLKSHCGRIVEPCSSVVRALASQARGPGRYIVQVSLLHTPLFTQQ
uniref:Pentraxin (PTX) domain-containing protein n=1 Tax=Callorhinchus milii TaxID=7868 RepID=A0A4W3IP93_CALMI